MPTPTYLDPSLIPSLTSYFGGNLPTQNNQPGVPTPWGKTPTGSTIGALTSIGSDIGFLPNPLQGFEGLQNGNILQTALSFLPIPGGSFLSGLLGSDKKPAWKPFLGPDGKYYFTNPNSRNPVPLPIVPGAPINPSGNYTKTAANTQAITDLLPYLNAAVNQGAVPTALSELAASQATSPGYAEMMTKLFNTYGPVMNEIGNKIQRENQLYQAGTTNQILEGAGQQTVADALKLQQSIDPEYFKSRELALGNLQKYFDQLSPNLSATENREIGQGLTAEGVRRGNAFAPSMSDTVANAMKYGQAGYGRQQQYLSNLSQGINNASAFLTPSKSGMDAFQIATGRTSMPNPGQALFPGISGNNSNQSSYGLAGNLLGGMNTLDTTGMNIAANKKDWMDQFNQLASGIGALGGAAGKAFAL